VGYGSAADAWDMIQPVEKGDGSRRAMLMALERRGVPADEVDMINPHGTSTPLGDKRETEAIWAVFGDHTPEIAISATKSMTGHMMGASGSFEAFATAMSVYEQCIPPTVNYRDPDPECNLDIVQGSSRPMAIRYALSNNIGLGGHNGAIILKRYEA
jgi:3-oxoacyl-[acyl-carrier-protein] synthase II